MIYTLPRYDNFTNTPPMTLLFQWYNGGIHTFFLEKNRAHRKNNTVVFVADSKNRQHKKHRFSQLVEISKIGNRKEDQKSLIGGLSTPKSFWEIFRSKNIGSPEILVGGPLITILGHFSEKTVYRLTTKKISNFRVFLKT